MGPGEADRWPRVEAPAESRNKNRGERSWKLKPRKFWILGEKRKKREHKVRGFQNKKIVIRWQFGIGKKIEEKWGM